ncbi:MAG: hypothetical protein ACI4SF_14150 [Oscillospiraceae bacterium]
MSGRKASEVNQLLRNGKNARSGAVDMINSSYRSVIDSEKRMISAIADAKSRLNNMTFDMSTAESEFTDAANRIKAELSELGKQISSLSEFSETKTLKSEFEELNREYEDTDRKAEKVSSDLKEKINSQGRSDPWYCDDEYRAANAVSKEYAALKKRANSLNNKLSNNVNLSNQLIARANKLAEQSDRLISEGKKLEEKAKQAAKLRADAGKARESVTGDLNAINADIARKFLPDEYAKIKSEVSDFCTLYDGEIVKKFSLVTSSIKEFSTELDKKYSEFLKKQSEVNALLGSIEQRFGAEVFTDPADDFRAGEHMKMDLISFLKKFCAGKYVDDISKIFEKAKRLFQKEEFVETEKELASLSDIVDLASEYAAAQHERQKVQLENALAIRDTMLKMKYDVRSRINKNSDGTIGGYDIICSAGDEEIIFENVCVNDDGNFGFGINHKESSTGTCSGSWHDIRNELAQNGIFIEDITKNGVSVHSANRSTVSKGNNTAERARG